MKYYGNNHESVEKFFSTDFGTGLSDKEAKKRLRHYGFNNIFELGKRSPSKVIYKLIYDPVSILLLISALVCFSYSSFFTSYLIIGVWLINIITTILAYYKADGIFYTIKSYGIPKTKVLRDSKVYMIDSRLLVPGDVIIVEAGDVICADCKIVKSEKLLAYEYDLCGSNEPRSKFVSDDTEAITLSEMHGMLFASSSIISGHGVCVVAATGENTEIVSTAGLMPILGKHEPEVFFDVKKQCRTWGIISTLIVTLLFVIKLIFSPTDVFSSFMLLVALMGASMSESLLPLTQVVTARGISHLAQKSGRVRSVIKNAGVIEALCEISYLIITPEILEFEDEESLRHLSESQFTTVICAPRRESLVLATKHGLSVCSDTAELVNTREKILFFTAESIEDALQLVTKLKKRSHTIGALTTRLNYIRMLSVSDIAFTYGKFKYKTNKYAKINIEGIKTTQNQILSRVSDVISEEKIDSVTRSCECAKSIFSTVSVSASYLLTMQFIRVILSALTIFVGIKFIEFSDILISGMIIDLLFVFLLSFYNFKNNYPLKFSNNLLQSFIRAVIIVAVTLCITFILQFSPFNSLNISSRTITVASLFVYPIFCILSSFSLLKRTK